MVAQEVLGSSSFPTLVTGEIFWMHSMSQLLLQETEASLGVESQGGRVVGATRWLSLVL